jgi:hypothetical protein
VKKIGTLPKYLSLMFGFYTQAQLGVNPPEPLL